MVFQWRVLMNRIDKKFRDLKSKKKPAFIPFITAGDPDLHTTKALILEFEKRGADIIELGIPFSDPIADGPIIQASYYRALVRGTKVAQILDMVSNFVPNPKYPLFRWCLIVLCSRADARHLLKKYVRLGWTA